MNLYDIKVEKRDGKKDLSLSYDGKRWIGAVYFPRGQKSFSEIKTKFLEDCEGIEKNDSCGIVFVTNQEISVGDRKELTESCRYDVSVYHLERISSILNRPEFYGVRLEFLEIEMNNEELVSYFVERDKRISRISDALMDVCFMLNDQSAERKVSEESIAMTEGRRRDDEVLSAAKEFEERVWYDRHLSLRYRVLNGTEEIDPDIWKRALESAERIENAYGEGSLGPYSDYEWGMINGKLSALRWVLGEDWDMLDT